MHVFVITASWISEHTVMTEVVGVYAHRHQCSRQIQWLKNEGKQVVVTKHEVTGFVPALALARPVGEGVQTDPSVGANRATSGAFATEGFDADGKPMHYGPGGWQRD